MRNENFHPCKHVPCLVDKPLCLLQLVIMNPASRAVRAQLGDDVPIDEDLEGESEFMKQFLTGRVTHPA